MSDTNKLEEVLALLGLKINQEFRLEGTVAIYKVTECGHVEFKEEETGIWQRSQWELSNLITGAARIIKKPYVPEHYDDYYYILIKYNFEKEKIVYYDGISQCVFKGSEQDIERYLVGNCFKTKEEAREKAYSIVNTYQSRFNSQKPFIDNTET